MEELTEQDKQAYKLLIKAIEEGKLDKEFLLTKEDYIALGYYQALVDLCREQQAYPTWGLVYEAFIDPKMTDIEEVLGLKREELEKPKLWYPKEEVSE